MSYLFGIGVIALVLSWYSPMLMAKTGYAKFIKILIPGIAGALMVVLSIMLLLDPAPILLKIAIILVIGSLLGALNAMSRLQQQEIIQDAERVLLVTQKVDWKSPAIPPARQGLMLSCRTPRDPYHRHKT